jgi:hypothetical protein
VDGYRDHPSDFEPALPADEAVDSAPVEIGTDERRMHVRAYNYWASLLDGRDYPSVEDLEPADLKDFAPYSVLLDFTAGRDDPATSYIGDAIRAECGLADSVQTIADVASGSLLSRLTDHYMQIIANRAPVGFEAEFVNQRGDNIGYRGILMPLSSDGDTIDFIYGVINWKTVAEAQRREARVDQQPRWTDDEQEPASLPIHGLDEPEEEPLELTDVIARPHSEEEDAVSIDFGPDAGLGDRLWAARENAEAAKAADGRSRTALYRALSQAFDFALASREDPDGYAELLHESGMKVQTRAPMTAVAKLVFGIDYDKARLTEFAAALSYAERQQVGLGGFLPLVAAQAGGLKALVAAERLARRPQSKPDDRTELARSKMRKAAPLAAIDSEQEFALVLARRSPDGTHALVAVLDDEALVERAIRQAAA